MAKNRKKKSASSDTSGPSGPAPSSSAAPSSSKAPGTPADKAVDAAFAAGNYSAIRHLAMANNAEAARLLPLTTVDMGQVAMGVIAMIVVLTVAFFVLHAG